MMKRIFFITCFSIGLILQSACSSEGDSSQSEDVTPAPGVKEKAEVIPKPKIDNYKKGGSFKIKSQEIDRTFLLRVPKSYDDTKELPLVISLHGAGENGSKSEKQSGFTALAQKENFIVTYPTGLIFGSRTGPAWTFFQTTSNGKEFNDVVFINDLINKIKSELKIDSKRIYLVGHSNGIQFLIEMGWSQQLIYL